MRTNQNNDGRDFQAEIQRSANEYLYRGWMRLRKVDPPSRVIGGGAGRRVIFLENPWLDFAGVWTERHGRAVFIEAKSTTEPKLAVDRDGGVTEKQADAIIHWRIAGAVAFVLWRCPNGCALLTGRDIADLRRRAQNGEGTRTLHFRDVRWPVPRGDNQAKVPWDFRETMLESL